MSDIGKLLKRIFFAGSLAFGSNVFSESSSFDHSSEASGIVSRIDLPKNSFEIDGSGIKFSKPVTYIGENEKHSRANRFSGAINISDGNPEFCFLYDGFFKEYSFYMPHYLGGRQKVEGFKVSPGEAWAIVDDDFIKEHGTNMTFFSNIYAVSAKLEGMCDNTRGVCGLSKTQIDGLYVIRNRVDGGDLNRRIGRFSPSFLIKIGYSKFFYGYVASDFPNKDSPFYKEDF